MTAPDHQFGAGFRADANPVHPVRRNDRTIGLHPDLEPACMQRFDQRRIDLQQRFAAGQYRVAVLAPRCPLPGDGIRKRLRRSITAAQGAVGADKISIAELTGRGGAVLLAAAPKIAAREPAKHRRASGMRAFALQGQKDLLDGVTHRVASSTAGPICRSASPKAIERRLGMMGMTSRASATLATSSGTPADSRPNSRTSAEP